MSPAPAHRWPGAWRSRGGPGRAIRAASAASRTTAAAIRRTALAGAGGGAHSALHPHTAQEPTMLIQIATHQPQMLLSIVQGTPAWVWGLLAALLWLGLSQMLPRHAGPRRVLLMPLALSAFSAWGLLSAFGAGAGGRALAAWLLATAAATLASLALRAAPPAGVRFDAQTLRFRLPGSPMPLLLILAIFLTKYLVGVELALQPQLAHDSHFALQVAALYGLYNGLLLARAARLWRLVQGMRPGIA
ncbi:DUF6622 family protein [Alicycliphilus denitrificans]|uniref:DUF6622 family protein n=1 Tax=Alicycliphilus denitrificans TaxID=179636 RepID=UPI00384FA1C3